MKKILAVLLALALALAFAACGGQTDTAAEEEGLTAIPLGGSLGEFALEGDAYGVYNQVDFPEGVEIPEGLDGKMYYAEGSDTPCIIVYRWANAEGKTLEEETAALAQEYDTVYEMVPWKAMNQDEVGCYSVGSYGVDDKYYYVECNVMKDGEEFVELDFYCATEEVALGETGQYVYVPVGYTDLMDEEETAHGAVFYGEYAEGYDLPLIWIGSYDGSYESLAWYWSEEYPDGLPFDEATYNGWVAQAEKDGWTDELNKQYYEALGCQFYEHEAVTLEDGNSVGCYFFTYGDDRCSELYFNIGEDCYNVLLMGDNPHYYGDAVIDSLHTK